MTQHKWHKEIHAWADGAEIEACSAGIWFSTDYPNWDVNNEFRIKPQPKGKKYLYAILCANGEIKIIPPATLFSGTVYGKIEVEND